MEDVLRVRGEVCPAAATFIAGQCRVDGAQSEWVAAWTIYAKQNKTNLNAGLQDRFSYRAAAADSFS